MFMVHARYYVYSQSDEDSINIWAIQTFALGVLNVVKILLNGKHKVFI